MVIDGSVVVDLFITLQKNSCGPFLNYVWNDIIKTENEKSTAFSLMWLNRLTELCNSWGLLV